MRALSSIDIILVLAGITLGVTTGVRVAVRICGGGRGMAAEIQHITVLHNSSLFSVDF